MQASWSRLISLALRNHKYLTSLDVDNLIIAGTHSYQLSISQKTLLAKKTYLPLELNQGFHWDQKGEWSKLTQFIQVLSTFLIITT